VPLELFYEEEALMSNLGTSGITVASTKGSIS
jgi:hypothetical protein